MPISVAATSNEQTVNDETYGILLDTVFNTCAACNIVKNTATQIAPIEEVDLMFFCSNSDETVAI